MRLLTTGKRVFETTVRTLILLVVLLLVGVTAPARASFEVMYFTGVTDSLQQLVGGDESKALFTAPFSGGWQMVVRHEDEYDLLGYWLLTLDDDGEVLELLDLNLAGGEEPVGLKPVSGVGTLLLVASPGNNDVPQPHALIRQVDPSFAVWSQRFNWLDFPTCEYTPCDVCPAPNGGFYLAGRHDNLSNTMPVFSRFDGAGNALWSHPVYPPEFSLRADRIAPAADGGLFWVGKGRPNLWDGRIHWGRIGPDGSELGIWDRVAEGGRLPTTLDAVSLDEGGWAFLTVAGPGGSNYEYEELHRIDEDGSVAWITGQEIVESYQRAEGKLLVTADGSFVMRHNPGLIGWNNEHWIHKVDRDGNLGDAIQLWDTHNHQMPSFHWGPDSSLVIGGMVHQSYTDPWPNGVWYSAPALYTVSFETVAGDVEVDAAFPPQIPHLKPFELWVTAQINHRYSTPTVVERMVRVEWPGGFTSIKADTLTLEPGVSLADPNVSVILDHGSINHADPQPAVYTATVEIRDMDGTLLDSDTALGWVGFEDQNGIPSLEPVTSVDPSEAPVRAYGLGPVYPNPFNPTATVTLTVPRATTVAVTVHDLLGRRVANLANGRFPAGTHHLTLDGSSLPSGVYLVRAEVPGMGTYVRRVTLLK